MHNYFCKLIFILGLILFLQAQNEGAEQTGMMSSKIKEYQEVLNLDAATISSDCQAVKKYYDTAIEAYNFLSTFTIETMEETLQKTLGQDLEQETAATFEQMALRKQLEETRNQRRLDELQWRVNWSATAKSSGVSEEEVAAMKDEISSISGDKQKELDGLIEQKTTEQTQLTEQIQLGESSFNKLNADKEDLNAAITVLNDKLESNANEIKEEMEANLTRGEKLTTLQLQLNFFEEQKKNAISFDSIKQLAQLQMRTQAEISKVSDDIAATNNKIEMLQESNVEANDSLITKKAEIQEIQLQMENVNQQLLQIKQQSEEVTNFLQKTKDEKAILLSQLGQKRRTSFLQLGQQLTDKEKELERAQQKVLEGKQKIERLEREEEMYQSSYMRAQQQSSEINEKLLAVSDPLEKEQLQEELQRYSSQYQRAWGNYIEKKEELVKQKQLLVTFENFETSIQNDKLEEEKEQIESKKEEQEKREQEIERKTQELDSKLKEKEEEKGEACSISFPDEENETTNESDNETEDDEPLIIPTIEPTPVKPEEITPSPPSLTPPVVEKEEQTKNETVPPEQQPQTPQPPQQTEPEEPEKIEEPEQPTVEPPKPHYHPPYIKHEEQDNEVVQQKISPEAEEEIEQAEQKAKKEKIVNEVQELLKQYEELIIIKEQHVEERLTVIKEKEEITIKRENEIYEASERIRQQVKECKEQKREIIVEARQEREQLRSRADEQLLRSELERINTQFKEEFKREAEIYKKKRVVEQKEEEVREKQATIDKKIEKIEKKMFKDVPKPKQSDKIEVDRGMHRPASPSYQRVEGSKVPLAYPWKERTFNFTDEVIQPKEEKEIAEEEINIQQQERKAKEQKEVVEEQKQEIQKEEREVQLKEYEIQQKEKHFEEKKAEVQEEISKLDEDIARCKIIFGQGDEQSQEYQMCQWQSTDYEKKKQQLEQMKMDYERELSEFTKTKEQFYQQQTSFVEAKVEIATEKFQKHLNSLAQLSSRTQKSLKKSIRHKNGMAHLLLTANTLSEELKTVLLSITDNTGSNYYYLQSVFLDELKLTVKQVLDEINKLYETARIQRNLKQAQNKLLEKKKVLMKMQGACLEAQRILQQQPQ